MNLARRLQKFSPRLIAPLVSRHNRKLPRKMKPKILRQNQLCRLLRQRLQEKPPRIAARLATRIQVKILHRPLPLLLTRRSRRLRHRHQPRQRRQLRQQRLRQTPQSRMRIRLQIQLSLILHRAVRPLLIQPLVIKMVMNKIVAL